VGAKVTQPRPPLLKSYPRVAPPHFFDLFAADKKIREKKTKAKKNIKKKLKRMLRTIIQKIDAVPDHYSRSVRKRIRFENCEPTPKSRTSGMGQQFFVGCA